MMLVNYIGLECRVTYEKYSNGNIAIQLWDNYDYCPVATASVNIKKLPHNQVAIKNYGENKGVETALINAGIIKNKPVSEFFIHGAIMVNVYELTETAIQEKNSR